MGINLHFTIDCIKLGFEKKQRHVNATGEGRKKSHKIKFKKKLLVPLKLYRRWRWEQKKRAIERKETLEKILKKTQIKHKKAILSQYEEEAYNGIRNFIISKNHMNFRFSHRIINMGYFISRGVAQRGPDDWNRYYCFYRCFAGTKTGLIIIVQVRNTNQMIMYRQTEVQKLAGTLKIRMFRFCSMNKFSKPTVKETRE
jgi:restriction system protein